MSEIKVQIEKTLNQRYMDAIIEIGELIFQKGGKNDFQNYEYFELKDFQNKVLKIFAKHGLCYWPPREKTIDGVPHFVVTVETFDGMQQKEFAYQIKESNSSKNEVQNFGAVLKYYRRYILSNIAGIVESDEIDRLDNSKNEPKQEPKVTDMQLEIIRQAYDEENISKILGYYQVAKLEDLTLKQASQVIAKKAKK